MNYSNPRMQATFADWPYGRELKTTATFAVESKPGKGQRVSRITLDPRNGRPSAPKTTTYGCAARIVDGDDGKTYVATLTVYGQVYIMQSNLQFSEESVFEGDPRYPALAAMFKA
jgi:hypothetical protein